MFKDEMRIPRQWNAHSIAPEAASSNLEFYRPKNRFQWRPDEGLGKGFQGRFAAYFRFEKMNKKRPEPFCIACFVWGNANFNTYLNKNLI